MEHVLILNKIEVFDQNALLAGTDRCGVPNKNLHWLVLWLHSNLLFVINMIFTNKEKLEISYHFHYKRICQSNNCMSCKRSWVRVE